MYIFQGQLPPCDFLLVSYTHTICLKSTVFCLRNMGQTDGWTSASLNAHYTFGGGGIIMHQKFHNKFVHVCHQLDY